MDVALSVEDVKRAKKEGKQAVMAQLEPQTIGADLELVNVAYGLGVRMFLLTLNRRNFIGDGCTERTDSGLSNFGFEVIERMNQIGMMIDVSHCGKNTTLETIEASKDPVVVSHSGVRALSPNNKKLKTNEEIKALADKDGVFGVFAGPNLLSDNERQGIHDLLNHVDYVTDLVGVNHAGIGLDIVFDDYVKLFHPFITELGGKLKSEYMEGIESPEEWPNITRGLVSRGYSDKEIEKIIGGNALRILERTMG